MLQNSSMKLRPKLPKIAWGGRVKSVAEMVVIALLAPLLAYLAIHHGNFATVDAIVYDQALKARPITPGSDVVIVAIDDASLATLGRWPWSRAVHASFLEKIAAGNPQAVLMDVFMTEPSADPADDVALVGAMHKVPVYLPLLFSLGYDANGGVAPSASPMSQGRLPRSRKHPRVWVTSTSVPTPTAWSGGSFCRRDPLRECSLIS